jgi:hypothetical protein
MRLWGGWFLLGLLIPGVSGVEMGGLLRPDRVDLLPICGLNL